MADRVVVLAEHPELAVVTAELPHERQEVLPLVDHPDDVHERPEQAAALHLHVDREQVAGGGCRREQGGVEVAGQLRRLLLDLGPARLITATIADSSLSRLPTDVRSAVSSCSAVMDDRLSLPWTSRR